MIFQKILAIIAALALSDLYIFLFKKLLFLYQKRINNIRTKEESNTGKLLPDITYKKSFTTRYSILIIICVIFGIITATLDTNSKYFFPLFRLMATYGIGYISITALIAMFGGKIRKIYNQIRYDDQYHYMINDDYEESDEDESKNAVDKLSTEEAVEIAKSTLDKAGIPYEEKPCNTIPDKIIDPDLFNESEEQDNED